MRQILCVVLREWCAPSSLGGGKGNEFQHQHNLCSKHATYSWHEATRSLGCLVPSPRPNAVGERTESNAGAPLPAPAQAVISARTQQANGPGEGGHPRAQPIHGEDMTSGDVGPSVWSCWASAPRYRLHTVLGCWVLDRHLRDHDPSFWGTSKRLSTCSAAGSVTGAGDTAAHRQTRQPGDNLCSRGAPAMAERVSAGRWLCTVPGEW